MKICLGPLEQAILCACLAYHTPKKEDEDAPELYRDELPALLWGWKGDRRYLGSVFDRPANRQPQTYPAVPAREYRAKQAALTRALQNLYQKNLIDAGSTSEATDLRIYSPRRAAMLGVEPARPKTEAEMTARHYPPSYLGMKPWSYKSTGRKPRMGRNMKAIRLTELGEQVATQLQVKSQTSSSDLTRVTITVEPPPPLTEAEEEAQRQQLAEAEATIKALMAGGSA